MPLIHVVLFAYRPSMSAAAIAETTARMLALKKDCVREMDGVKQPYILYASGGPNVSREGAEASGSLKYTHVFVSHFASEADRDYYVNDDVAHREFKAFVKERVDGVLVMDYWE